MVYGPPHSPKVALSRFFSAGDLGTKGHRLGHLAGAAPSQRSACESATEINIWGSVRWPDHGFFFLVRGRLWRDEGNTYMQNGVVCFNVVFSVPFDGRVVSSVLVIVPDFN